MTNPKALRELCERDWLVIEVCHDFINRAMRCEPEDDSLADGHAQEYRDKEAAIRAVLAQRAALLDENAKLKALLGEACDIAWLALPDVPVDMSDEVNRIAAIRREGKL